MRLQIGWIFLITHHCRPFWKLFCHFVHPWFSVETLIVRECSTCWLAPNAAAEVLLTPPTTTNVSPPGPSSEEMLPPPPIISQNFTSVGPTRRGRKKPAEKRWKLSYNAPCVTSCPQRCQFWQVAQQGNPKLESGHHLLQASTSTVTKLSEEWKMILTDEDSPYFQQAQQIRHEAPLYHSECYNWYFKLLCVLLYLNLIYINLIYISKLVYYWSWQWYVWVGGVVVHIPAFHAGCQGFDSHIRQS